MCWPLIQNHAMSGVVSWPLAHADASISACMRCSAHAPTICPAQRAPGCIALKQAHPCLQAPKWEFPLDEGQQPGGGGAPLYLGTLPARPPAQCTAILGFRPKDLPPGMAGILGASQAAAGRLCACYPKKRLLSAADEPRWSKSVFALESSLQQPPAV